MSEEWANGNKMVYEALKQWFINDIYQNASVKMENNFFEFLKKNKDVENGLAGRDLLLEAGKENLIKFLDGDGKKKPQPVVTVKHTAKSFLQMAKVFIRMGDTALGGESIWAAFSIAVSDYARSFRPVITFESHEKKNEFFKAVFHDGTKSGIIDTAEACHKCLYLPFRKSIPDLQVAHGMIKEFTEELAERVADDEELERIEVFRKGGEAGGEIQTYSDPNTTQT